MNKTIISYFLIFLLTFCSQAMGSSDRQIYDPKDTKFLEEAEGSEALKWAKERTERTKKSFSSMPEYKQIKKEIESIYSQTSIKQL